MELWQQLLVVSFGIISGVAFAKGYYECKYKKNPYGLMPYFVFLGIFVRGDAVVFGAFWVIASLVVLVINDWLVFLLIVSLFWVARSIGETIYWIHEQFAVKHRNPPSTLIGHSIFPNDSIWFVYQTFWQCVMVLAIIASLFIVRLWFRTL